MKKNEKYDINQIANWFLMKEPMDQKKLQKLCYFSYAWYLYLCNENENLIMNYLFKNDIQGWVHGPVSERLYKSFPFKNMELLYPQKKYIPISKDDEETINILEFVYNRYKSYTGCELETLACRQKPWIDARNGLNPYEPGLHPLDDITIFNTFKKIARNEK